MSRGARVALAAVIAASSVAALFACNAIVGVEDVTLRPRQTIDNFKPSPSDDDSGDPSTPKPRPNVFQVALGDLHSCARKTAGSVKCWGDDVQGQTGAGPADGGFFNTPHDVVGIDDAVDIAAGKSHTCVARRSGRVSCWGYNLDGQIGNGASGNKQPAPAEVVAIDDAFAVAAGGNFSCAAHGSGTVSCWGGNGTGQLGTGDQSPSLTPKAVIGLDEVVALAAGQAHACALKSDGTVLCWGEGANGQLGSGTAGTGTSTPAPVGALAGTIAIAAGERFSCALEESGSIHCWGANELGQLGSGASNTTSNPSPVVVTGVSDAVAIGAGKNHACAVRKEGAVVCWGDGTAAQLGDGKIHLADGGGAPVPVSDLATAIGAGGGSLHSCAPTRTNAISCWGTNARGQLGNGGQTTQKVPTGVAGYP